MTTRIKVSFWIDCASFNDPIEYDLLSSVLADDKLDTIISDVAGFVVGKLKKEQQGVYMAGIDNITIRALNIAKQVPDVVEIQPLPVESAEAQPQPIENQEEQTRPSENQEEQTKQSENPDEQTKPSENPDEHKWIKKRIESLDGTSSNLWWQCEKCLATPTLVLPTDPASNRHNENMPNPAITVCRGFPGSKRLK